MFIEAENGSAAYVALTKALLASQSRVAPRASDTQEIRDVTVRIERGSQAAVTSTARVVSAKIAATEAVHLLAATSSLAQLDAASGGNFSQFADGGKLRGAYGPRLGKQYDKVIKQLETDRSTRQAVLTIWNGEEALGASRDIPCTQALQFLIRDDRLHLRVTMRSSDIFLGVPYDWQMFSHLQGVIAHHLGITVGSYTHTAGSQHLYERNRNQAAIIAETGVITGHRDRGMSEPLPVLIGSDHLDYYGGDFEITGFHRSQHLAKGIVSGWFLSSDGAITTTHGNGQRLSDDVLWYLGHVPQCDNQFYCWCCGYTVPIEWMRYDDDEGAYVCMECTK